MDVKQWMGMAGAGVGAIALSIWLNSPTDLSKAPGARPLVADARAPAAGAGGAAAKPPPVPTAAPKPPPPKPAAPKEPAKPVSEPKAKEAPAPATPPKPAPVAPASPPVPLKPGEKGPGIRGVVTWTGPAPKNLSVVPSSDAECMRMHGGAEIRGETYTVNPNGTLKGVVVYVSEGLPNEKWPVRPETIVLDQKGCRYIPHVVAVQVGQKVEIKNSDRTTHDVNFKSNLNGVWKQTQATIGTIPAAGEFTRPELGTAIFKCNMHTWMESKVAIFNHPFFDVTGDDGSFTISGLPPGNYTLSTWHEKEKPKTLQVKVEAGAMSEAGFAFKK